MITLRLFWHPVAWRHCSPRCKKRAHSSRMLRHSHHHSMLLLALCWCMRVCLVASVHLLLIAICGRRACALELAIARLSPARGPASPHRRFQLKDESLAIRGVRGMCANLSAEPACCRQRCRLSSVLLTCVSAHFLRCSSMLGVADLFDVSDTRKRMLLQALGLLHSSGGLDNAALKTLDGLLQSARVHCLSKASYTRSRCKGTAANSQARSSKSKAAPQHCVTCSTVEPCEAVAAISICGP